MTPMIWPICCADFAIASMASTACCTTTALLLGVVVGGRHDFARMIARLRRDFFTVAVISFERGGCLFEARRLLLGPAGQVVGRGGDLFASR